MPAAFVTGGSGFVGGALIERLRREGWDVRALARSERAAERVRELGAEPVMGDLGRPPRSRKGEIAFHAAAKVEDFGDPADFERVERAGHAERGGRLPDGRRAAARARGHGGRADGRAAARERGRDRGAPAGLARRCIRPRRRKAEQVVRAANADGLETVVVRPRFVWGRGDTSLLPAIIELVRSQAASAGSAAAAI